MMAQPVLVLFVLNDQEHLAALLDSWTAAGVTGITLLDTTGMQRIVQALRQDDAPIFASLRDLLREGGPHPHVTHHKTLFSIVPDLQVADTLLQATEQVIGDLNQPHTGIFCVVPLLMVKGLGT